MLSMNTAYKVGNAEEESKQLTVSQAMNHKNSPVGLTPS